MLLDGVGRRRDATLMRAPFLDDGDLHRAAVPAPAGRKAPHNAATTGACEERSRRMAVSLDRDRDRRPRGSERDAIPLSGRSHFGQLALSLIRSRGSLLARARFGSISTMLRVSITHPVRPGVAGNNRKEVALSVRQEAAGTALRLVAHEAPAEAPRFGDQLIAVLPRLRRFARGLTGSAVEADDLVQAACERALARRASVSGGYAVRQLDVPHRADDLDRPAPGARRAQGGWRDCRGAARIGRAGAPGRGAAGVGRGPSRGRPPAAGPAGGAAARDGGRAQLQGGGGGGSGAGRHDHEPAVARPDRAAAPARSRRRRCAGVRRMQKRSDDRSSPISTASSRRRSGARSRPGSMPIRRRATSWRRSPNRRSCCAAPIDEVAARAAARPADRRRPRARRPPRPKPGPRSCAFERRPAAAPRSPPAALAYLAAGCGLAVRPRHRRRRRLSRRRQVPRLGGSRRRSDRPALEAAAADNAWLDNAAGYFKLLVSRRRQRAGRCAGHRRHPRGAAKDQPEPAAAGAPAGPEAVGPQFPRRPAGGRRRAARRRSSSTPPTTRRSGRWP